MCAACVAQGAVYVGGALTGLQVMAARARRRRAAAPVDEPAGDPGRAADEPAPAAPPEPVGGPSGHR
jgi:hypothetical protein